MASAKEDSPKPKPEVEIHGAFEIFEGNTENLITVTRGRLPQVGDKLPTELTSEEIRVLNIVNAFGTPDCDSCTRKAESIFSTNPYIELIHVSKQSESNMRLQDEKENEIKGLRISISDETAKDLGVYLRSGEGSDPQFWPTALRRTLIVAEGDEIKYIEQPPNQALEPDFNAAFELANRLSEETS